ncbi:MFS transporter [Porphyromonas pogonae]|uniref:MFS transporter n=1 Tax=Porphyromonas pogonae TaxID=867595 RepID=UPI002E77EC21|nr:MFS transporter [Porphyromonas pogonae]
MKQNDWAKFPILFSLYIAQSIPMSFFSTVVPIIMRQEQYSLASIGLLQLIKLPWVFKFLWAPVVDNKGRTSGSLKRWIVFSEMFYALVILCIGMFSLKTDFSLIVILIILSFIASATQDIAVDKYAILTLKKEERGLGNSMQSAGSFIGSLFGTGILLMAYHYYGWSNVLLLLSLFIVVAVLPLLLRKEQSPIQQATLPSRKVNLKDIVAFFSAQNNLPHILILIFYYSGIIGIMTMLKPFMVDLGYSTKEIAFMLGIFGCSVAALCAFASGFTIKLIGRKKALYLFLGISFITALYFWVISGIQSPTRGMLYMGIALIWGAYGLSTVGVYTISMDQVRPGREGTDFTIQIMLTHLSSLLISSMSGKISDLWGYSNLFLIEAGLSLLTFFILSLSKREKNIHAV